MHPSQGAVQSLHRSEDGPFDPARMSSERAAERSPGLLEEHREQAPSRSCASADEPQEGRVRWRGPPVAGGLAGGGSHSGFAGSGRWR